MNEIIYHKDLGNSTDLNNKLRVVADKQGWRLVNKNKYKEQNINGYDDHYNKE